MSRFTRVRIAGLAVLAAAAIMGAAGRDTAQAAPTTPPARFNGTISLFGGKATGSVAVRAYIGGTDCGTGRLQGGGYTINVSSASQKPGCGEEGSLVRFTLGEYWAYEYGTWEEGGSQPVNLTGPETQDISLPADCDTLTLTFANKTTIATLAASIAPASAIDSLWKWNGKDWESYFPDAPASLNTLKTINRGDEVWFCMFGVATLRQPVPAPTVSSSAALPDLTVTIDPVASAGQGGIVTYRVNIRNQGTGNATGVKMVQSLPTLPAGSTVTIFPAGGFSCPSTGTPPGQVTVTCTGGTFNAGAFTTIMVSVQLPAGQPSVGTVLSTTAVVDPENTIAETNNGNNTDTKTTNVV